MKDLNGLFHHLLKDIYYAEKQIVKALPKMAKATESTQLRQAFEHHLEETKGQVDRLEQVFEIIGKEPRGEKCRLPCRIRILCVKARIGEGGRQRTRERRLETLHAPALLVDENQEFTGKSVVQKLFSEIAPSFGDRQGGYTRIIKLSDYRIGDGGSLVILQLLTEKSAPSGTARRSAGLRRKRNERRHQFAAKVLKGKGKSEQTAATETAPA